MSAPPQGKVCPDCRRAFSRADRLRHHIAKEHSRWYELSNGRTLNLDGSYVLPTSDMLEKAELKLKGRKNGDGKVESDVGSVVTSVGGLATQNRNSEQEGQLGNSTGVWVGRVGEGQRLGGVTIGEGRVVRDSLTAVNSVRVAPQKGDEISDVNKSDQKTFGSQSSSVVSVRHGGLLNLLETETLSNNPGSVNFLIGAGNSILVETNVRLMEDTDGEDEDRRIREHYNLLSGDVSPDDSISQVGVSSLTRPLSSLPSSRGGDVISGCNNERYDRLEGAWVQTDSWVLCSRICNYTSLWQTSGLCPAVAGVSEQSCPDRWTFDVVCHVLMTWHKFMRQNACYPGEDSSIALNRTLSEAIHTASVDSFPPDSVGEVFTWEHFHSHFVIDTIVGSNFPWDARRITDRLVPGVFPVRAKGKVFSMVSLSLTALLVLFRKNEDISEEETEVSSGVFIKRDLLRAVDRARLNAV